jgi:hypothetical protein
MHTDRSLVLLAALFFVIVVFVVFYLLPTLGSTILSW